MLKFGQTAEEGTVVNLKYIQLCPALHIQKQKKQNHRNKLRIMDRMTEAVAPVVRPQFRCSLTTLYENTLFPTQTFYTCLCHVSAHIRGRMTLWLVGNEVK